jgi:hypothetical protein
MKKFKLLTVIIFGIIVFPLVISALASSSWYTPSDNPYDCSRCHEKIVEEFQSNTGAHNNFSCNDCHLKSDSSYTLTPTFNLTWLKLEVDEPHAAISTKCVDCHSEAAKRLENNSEAHLRFYNESLNLPVSPSSTCIACHTHAKVNVSWQQITYINFEINVSEGITNVKII